MRSLFIAAALLGLIAQSNLQGAKLTSIGYIPLRGQPFGIVTTQDGKTVFVSTMGARFGDGPQSALTVLEVNQGKMELAHQISLSAMPNEMVLTHDGKTLIVSTGDAVLLLSVPKLLLGREEVEARFSDESGAQSIFVNLTHDDQTLFVSDESRSTITVMDLARLRSERSAKHALLGRIPVGLAPIALTFSLDERWLYTTSEAAPRGWKWPSNQGGILVIDAAKARLDPEHAVVARVPAGHSPVRLALSPSGDRLYATIRGDNEVRVFDPEQLRLDPDHALLAKIPVGSSPVPLILVNGGQTLLVGNSDRFSNSKNSSISIIDPRRAAEGAKAVIGTLPTGGFPREFRLLGDGPTVFLADFSAMALHVLRVEN